MSLIYDCISVAVRKRPDYIRSHF